MRALGCAVQLKHFEDPCSVGVLVIALPPRGTDDLFFRKLENSVISDHLSAWYTFASLLEIQAGSGLYMRQAKALTHSVS